MTKLPASNVDHSKTTHPVLLPREFVEVENEKTMVGKVSTPPDRVKAIYDGEVIKTILVSCTCGQVMSIDCEYETS